MLFKSNQSERQKRELVEAYKNFNFLKVYDRMIYFNFEEIVPDIRMFPLLYDSYNSEYSDLDIYFQRVKKIKILPKNFFSLCFIKNEKFSYESIKYISEIIGVPDQGTDYPAPQKVELDNRKLRSIIKESYSVFEKKDYTNYYYTAKTKDSSSECKSGYLTTKNGIVDYSIKGEELHVKEDFGDKNETVISIKDKFNVKIDNKDIIILKHLVDDDILYQVRRLEELINMAELYEKTLRIDFCY